MKAIKLNKNKRKEEIVFSNFYSKYKEKYRAVLVFSKSYLLEKFNKCLSPYYSCFFRIRKFVNFVFNLIFHLHK